jgi:hypothetical protein
MAADHIVALRVSAETKSRLAALARELGVTETQIVRGAIDRMVAGHTHLDGPEPRARPALTRVTIRVRVDDRQLLADRAASRGMPPATYVSALVRAHLRQLAPLPAAELAALKASAAQIRAVGRLLNQFVRAVQRGAPDGGFTVEDARLLVRACLTVRAEVKDVISANVASWETGHAE